MLHTTTLFTRKETGKNMVGVIYLPKGTGKGEGVKFFDALVHGVPVEIKDKKKIISQDRFDKILEKNSPNGQELNDLEFVRCTFEGVDFKSVSLYNLTFKECEFLNCTFHKARLNDCLFTECKLDNCTFKEGAVYIDLKDCHLVNCDFSDSCMGTSRFDTCVLFDVNFTHATIRRSSFYKCTLETPVFTVATLDGVYFHGCTIENANYDGITITMGGATTEEVAIHRNIVLECLS